MPVKFCSICLPEEGPADTLARFSLAKKRVLFTTSLDQGGRVTSSVALVRLSFSERHSKVGAMSGSRFKKNSGRVASRWPPSFSSI